MSTVPVVIVGAGPTGITAATLLAQYGIECLVLDRYQTVYPQPRAVHLDDEVNRILAQLGIAEEFAAISRPALGLRLLDKEFNTLAEFHRDPADAIHGFPQANMFDQPELEALLRSNLARYPSASLRGNSEVIGITQHDGGVRVTYTARNSGEEHIVDASYVLGCDGANSVTAESIGAVMHDLKFEQRWLVVDIATDADLSQWEGVHQVCNPQRAATYMRIGTGRYRWEFRLLATETADDFSALPALRGLIGPWLGGVCDEDLRLLRVAEYTFRARVADRWRDRNVFLLGDAAHLTPPFIGQGMGAGLRDAINLSWKLAGVLTGILPEPVLNTYEQERKPHARKMIRLALGMGWAMTAGGRLGDAVRRLIASRLRLVPRSLVTGSRTPALSRSALVIRSWRPRRLAGTLCPNVPMGDATRLDTLLGNGFGLVTARELDATELGLLRRRCATAVTAAPGGELARWLHRGAAEAAIVRPDRTVMRAGSAAHLCRIMPDFMLPGQTALVTPT
ncbi:MAG: bifunctional 3-(3-hydroxy-phenyl)propionate/3-hydroxycinnamic acid hydroxylase [Mycobacteriaceae bacterium]|nr:bifunctional 3-(3-hydroxy-phenyl)propionate/3-hydroxycinnamic acid hydroxylase [Mycobacteriaceae bacterium]